MVPKLAASQRLVANLGSCMYNEQVLSVKLMETIPGSEHPPKAYNKTVNTKRSRQPTQCVCATMVFGFDVSRFTKARIKLCGAMDGAVGNFICFI